MRLLRKHWIYIALILMSVTPLLWYMGKPGMIINGLDMNFPLDPLVWFARRFYVWNDTINAGIDATTSTSGWFFHLIQVIPFALGFSLRATQMFSLVFWFGAVVFGSFYFAKAIITKNKLAQLLIVFIYSYNIYLFNTWENVKVANLALVVGLPLFLGLIHRYVYLHLPIRKLIPCAAFFSIVIAGSGINPAYFIALVGAVVLYLFIVSIFEFKRIRYIWKGGFAMLSILVLVNFFWILPFARSFFFGSQAQTLEEIGYTNWLSALSENTSLLNVIRLQGAWDWYASDASGFPLYIPHALNYFRSFPFIAFSFVVPFLVLLSFVFKTKKKMSVYSFFGVILAIGIFMGAGLHEPTGAVYSFLVRYVPYLSFFRSPWYIFTPYVTLAYASLVGLLFATLSERWGKRKIYKSFSVNKLFTLAFIVFFFARLTYLYPMVFGKIYRVGRPDSFFVNFPDYVFESSDWLDSRASKNRVITYPDDDLEQFDWGYRGTESILSLSSNQEVIAPSFVFENDTVKSILGRFHADMKRGNYDSAKDLVKVLNVDTLMVKNDAISSAKKINPRIFDAISFGKWKFYDLGDDISKIRSVSGIYLDKTPDSESLVRVMSTLDTGSVTVLEGDSEARKIMKGKPIGSFIRELDSISYEANPTGNRQSYFIDVPEGIYSLAVELSGFNSSDLSVSSSTIPLEGVATYSTDTMYVLEDVAVPSGEHILDVSYPESFNLVATDEVLESQKSLDLREDELPEEGSTIVAYGEGEDDNRIKIPISRFDPMNDYMLEFDYKYFYGRIPIVDIFQSSETVSFMSLKIPSDMDTDWAKKSVLVSPARVESNLTAHIVVPGKEEKDRSKTFFENISLRRVYDNRIYAIESGKEVILTPNVSFEKISPVEYRVSVSEIEDNYLLVFAENYKSDWVLKSDSNIGKPLHFKVNGYANAWYIAGNEEVQEFTIYYKAQDYYYFGVLISITTILVSVMIYLLFARRKRK